MASHLTVNSCFAVKPQSVIKGRRFGVILDLFFFSLAVVFGIVQKLGILNKLGLGSTFLKCFKH